MRTMKNSGVGWIDAIPSDWKIKRNKYCFTNKKEIAGIHSEKYERLALTLNGVVKRSKEDNEGLQPQDFDKYQILRKNELVFKLIDLQNISTSRVGLCDYIEGLVSPAYIILKPSKEVHPSYAEKFFLMMWHNRIFNILGDAGVRSSLNANELLELPFCLPPIEEQKKIADYLDAKNNEVNALAGDIEKEIEKLEEYKRSIIVETVTKGLKDDCEMSDTNIEYVGEAPSSWEKKPLYMYFEERKNKNKFLIEENLLSLSYGKIIRKDINTVGGLLPESFSTYNIVEKNDIIIRPTDLQNDKKSLRTGLCTERGIITSAYIALKPKTDVDTRFFQYQLHAFDVMKVFYNMGNGVRQGLNYSEFSKLMMLVPPVNEQMEIADFLDTKCKEIDEIKEIKSAQLEKLQDYKKSIIYEYVTGKKEVLCNE